MAQKTPKLLVVDDEPDQYNSIKSYFSRRNFLVFTASAGEEALNLIKENKPDLVLLDLKLSGNLNGKDILSLLREYDKKTKVLVITGDILNRSKTKELKALGVAKLLDKPVDFKTLERSIEQILKKEYPKPGHLKTAKLQKKSSQGNLSHDLSNIASDISNKCELFILDTEEGLNKDKSEKERLEEATNILRSVLKSTERLTDLIKKIPRL